MSEQPPTPRNVGRRVTIVDVAASAGVSLSTASKALNGRDRVDPETRARVKQVAADLGYRPNVRARRLRNGRSHSIALLSALPSTVVRNDARLGFLLELALPVASSCLDRDYSLLLVPPLESLEKLDDLDVDGAIVVDPVADDPIITRFTERGVKVVTVGCATAGQADGCLDRGDGGASAMIAHLAAAGARHVAAILTHESYASTDALLGWLASPPPGAPRITIARASAAEGIGAGERAAEALLDDPTIDAIYAPLDSFALGAVATATRRGLAIPDQLMIATNYDGRRAAESRPPLTALDLGLATMGADVVDLLFRVFDGDEQPRGASPTPVVVPRESTARATIPADR